MVSFSCTLSINRGPASTLFALHPRAVCNSPLSFFSGGFGKLSPVFNPLSSPPRFATKCKKTNKTKGKISAQQFLEKSSRSAPHLNSRSVSLLDTTSPLHLMSQRSTVNASCYDLVIRYCHSVCCCLCPYIYIYIPL